MKPDKVTDQPDSRQPDAGRDDSLHRTSPTTYEAQGALTPLTGRDTEVSLLKDRWEQAQEGMGQIVLMVGDAGLGKSRLVRTIKQIVLESAPPDSAQSPVLEWVCSQRLQNTGLHPVAEYFVRLLKFDVGDSPTTSRFDRLANYLDECGLGSRDLVALFAKLLFLPTDERYPGSGLPPIREREETFRALRQWLRACTLRQPVLFVVEDLHWIDASTLEFLRDFILEGLHDRILTVLTFRPEFETSWPAVAHQTSLALNRLTRRQVAQLMGAEAGKRVPDSLVSQIYQRTGGVPLLVEEFTRMIRESVGFTPVIGQSLAIREPEIPATLQELVMGRLDRMSTNRAVAQLAATLGREFHYEMLAAVAPVDEPTLQAELAKLASAEILYATGEPPQCAYQFKHALLEEALHSSLDEDRRREFHRQVAEVMETRFPQSAETQPELVALHFTEAGQIGKAVDYWLKAGLRARDQFANIEAINHLTRGLELLSKLEATPERDARELALLGPLGTAYIAARGYAAPEVSPVFQRARTLGERVGETPQLFATMRGNFAFHIVRGDFRLCTELAAETVEFAERLNDPGLLMESLFLKGLTMLYRGDFAGARDCCARAIADYDDRERTAFWATLTGEDSGVIHRCYLALAWWHLGCPDRALEMNREARDLARALNQPFNIEYALHHTGWLHQHCRLGAETESAGREEMDIATEQGFLFWHASGTLYTAAGLLLQGQFEKGLPLLEKGLEAYRASGAGLGLPFYLSILADALMQVGRFDEAHRAVREALDLVEKNDERFQEAELHRLNGELLLADSGEQAGAEDCIRRAIEVAREQGSRSWELRATMSLAQLWHRKGWRDKSFIALNDIFGTFHEGFTTPDLLDAAALLKDLGNERMREDVAAGIQYVHDRIPPPCEGIVSVDWRYIPASTLGGDMIGFHWLDDEHLALYLIDVTGHGLDSALLSVTISNVIRSGSLSGADMTRPDQVLSRLNKTFPGRYHGKKYFTAWFGVYHTTSRTLTYASGGHPAAIVIAPDDPEPLILRATGPMMGVLPAAEFPASSFSMACGARLLIVSDGVFEIIRDKRHVWNLPACIEYLKQIREDEENVMDPLLTRARQLRGSPQLDDDFSIIEARFH